MEIKAIKDKTQWESFLRGCEEKTFLQSFNWGEFQKAIGEKVWRFGIYNDGDDDGDDDDGLLAMAQVLKIKAKRGTFLFVPHGPLLRGGNYKFQITNNKQIPNSKSQILKTLLKKLKEAAKEEKASFIRVASIWERNEENVKIFQGLGFRPAPLHIHPEVTWELDITPSEKDLLMAMRKTTRYLIRQGLKNEDLKVFQSTDIKDLEIFNDIYQKTAKRHEFTPFSFDYLKKQFLTFLPDDQISLFLAQYRGEAIAGAIIVFWQGRAFYHHGASLQNYPKVPASYLIQWEAILGAKKRGCRVYNFWGIADQYPTSNIPARLRVAEGKSGRQHLKSKKRHPWLGLTLFKQGFGGYRKECVKTQDYVLSPKYILNYLVETIRRIKRGY